MGRCCVMSGRAKKTHAVKQSAHSRGGEYFGRNGIKQMSVEAVISTQVIDTTSVGRSLMTAADAAAARTAADAQVTLVSGTNIKTVNSTSLLGSGDITVGLSGTGSVDNAALRADGTGGATLQNSNLEIADLLTASPNNTVNALCVGPVGATTNVDLVLKPKGSGAVQAHVADSTSTGGNKRGANAVDWQTTRSSATQVASGLQSVVVGGSGNTASAQYATVLGGFGNVASSLVSMAGGYLCTASFYESVAFGYNATSSGQASFSMGLQTNASAEGSQAFGYKTTASGNESLAHGLQSVANKLCQRSMASGRFSGDGDAQASDLVVRNSTANATQTELFLNGSSARITIPNDTTWAFECLLVARRTDADNESAAYRITGCIDRNANAASTALVGSPTVTVISEDTAAWDVDAVADTTNGSLNFRVTGEAAKTIRWVGWVRLVEVTG